MVLCYIGIGSNLGNRNAYIKAAIDSLKKVRGIEVKKISTIYETEPASDIPQGRFLNGVLRIRTSLKPKTLLKKLNAIEERLGRARTVKNGPRTIDLDILYYGDERVKEKGLTIPHPMIGEREFVLKGLRELGVSTLHR